MVCVAPFNYPINEFLTTVVPALLMGNVVIAKTPRFGVLATSVLLEAFRDCFPAGVVGLLPGDGRVVLPAVMAATEHDVAAKALCERAIGGRHHAGWWDRDRARRDAQDLASQGASADETHGVRERRGCCTVRTNHSVSRCASRGSVDARPKGNRSAKKRRRAMLRNFPR